MEDALIPISIFGFTAASIWAISHFSYKKRQAAHETLRHAIDGGQQVSMDMIEKLSLVVDPVRADLRRGVMFIAFGLAFIFLAILLGSEDKEAIKPMFGVASFPIILGLAYLALWKFGHQRK